MRLIRPSFEIMAIMEESNPLLLIEDAGRTCYKSEANMTPETSKKFVQKLNKRGHLSVIEHSAMTIKFIIDRGVSHELVRHRLCAFSQESTRYCNYKDEVTFIIPPWLSTKEEDYSYYDYEHGNFSDAEDQWMLAMLNAEYAYKTLLSLGWSPQQARSVLPNSLKTELVVTTNFREWKHIFTLRCDKSSHPQMREIMIPTLNKVKTIIPVIFDELNFGD